MTKSGPGPSVLVVAHYYPPHIGGVEVVAAAEAEGMVARGSRVAVLTSDCGAEPGCTSSAGVVVRRVRAWNGLEARGVPFPVFAPSLLFQAWRMVRRADVVHIHDALYIICWVVALACRLQRTPYVVTQHVGPVYHSARLVRVVQEGVRRTAGMFVLRGARCVLPINSGVAGHTREVLGADAPVQVLRNGVDTGLFRPAEAGERLRLRLSLGLPARDKLVLYVGRFVPKKGFAEVAAATSPDYRLVFVGGPRPAELAPEDGRVFLGSLGREALAEVYRAVDAFVCASVGESPLTVPEAMSSGLPVLLHEDPGQAGLDVDEAAVVLADLRDGSLRRRLEELLSQPGRLEAMARTGRLSAELAHSWETHVDRLEEVYSDARRSPGRPSRTAARVGSAA